jgi:twitching motility two-component system response regulator PilH
MPAKILVADDSATLRRIVSSVLTAQGHEVITAVDGLEAAEQVYTHAPDLVVLDVQMPRMSGYVLTRLLKEDWSTAHIPVVLLTAKDGAGDRYWGLKTGANRYLTKDFDSEDLVELVEGLLEEDRRSWAGREALKPRPEPAGHEDIVGKMSDILDRRLLEATLAAEVASLAVTTHRYQDTVAGLLGLLARFVDFHTAGVLLFEERDLTVRVNHPTAEAHLAEVVAKAVDAARQVGGVALERDDVSLSTLDPDGRLGRADLGPVATFLSMPLRSRDGVFGMLALSSPQPGAFSEEALKTLRLLDQPVAVVVDNARMSAWHFERVSR